MNLLDDQTGNIVKTLILEENIDVFRHINSYIAKAIDEQELVSHLIRLAQQLSGSTQAFGAMQRPMSPIPKNKKQLLKFVEQLARYHFNNKEDLDLLNRLIQEENEFVHGIFDVFDSDKDHESLIDSLQRLLDKCRETGYRGSGGGGQQYPSNQWQRPDAGGQFLGQRYSNGRGMHQTMQTNHSFGVPPQNISSQQQNLSNRPETSMWPERIQLSQQTPGSQSFHQQQLQGRDNNMFYPVNQGQRHHSIARVDGQSLRADQTQMGRRGNMNRVRGNRRDLSHNLAQNTNQPFVPPTSYPVEKIPNYFNSDEDEGDGTFPGAQGGTFQNKSLGQMRTPNSNMRSFQGNHTYKIQNQQQYKRLDAKSYGGMGGGRALDFKGTASFQFDNINGSGIQQYSNSVHQSDDRAFLQERNFAGNAQRQGLMSNQPYRRNPVPRNNNFMMGGSMQRQEYSSKHQDESENDETRGQMAFLARGSVNAKPKGPLEASGYRNINNDGQDLIQSMPNGSFSPYYEQQNVDYGRQGNGAGILVDYDEYGYEVMDTAGGPFSGSLPMPPGSTYYPEHRGQQPSHSRTTKPPRKPYKNKVSASKQGGRSNQGRRRNPRRKYSSEDERIQEYDGQYYGRQGQYPNDTDGDDLNARLRGTAGGPTLMGPTSYGREEYYEEMSGKSDFYNDSSQSSSSASDYSSSSEASSSSKRIQQLLQQKPGQQRGKRSKQTRGSKQGGKSKSKKDRKVSKKKKRGNKPPKISKGDSEQYRQSKKVTGQIDYQKIIERENLAMKMRTDNYAILLYLIDNNDQEMRTSFQNHIVLSQGKHGAEQSNLLAEVQAKTEETFLFLLQKYLNNQEQTSIFNRRSSKDEAYIDTFRQFIFQNQFSLDNLMRNLQNLAVTNVQEFKKEKYESIFYKVLLDQTFKKNQEKDLFLRQQFDNDNEELFQILSMYENNPNLEQLKQDMHLFVQKHCGPDVYQSLRDAIQGLSQKGALLPEDRDLIMQLSFRDDRHLMAAWWAYSVLQDDEDLADSFRTLCEAKRSKEGANSQASTKMTGNTFQIVQQNVGRIIPGNNENSQIPSMGNGSSENMGDMGECEVDKADSRASNQNKRIDNNQPNQMMYNQAAQQQQNSNQVSQQMYQASLQGQDNFQPNNSPDGSLVDPDDGNQNGSDDIDPDTEDQEDFEDIESIMQYQHKILRKYAMLGMIQYSAIPFFHQLVENRDYKMICIFEVFAQNRNEDDFLENLGILDNIRIAGEEQQMRTFPQESIANAGELIDAGQVASCDEEQLQDSQIMVNVPGIELMGNMKNNGRIDLMGNNRSLEPQQNQMYQLPSSSSQNTMMSPMQPQSKPYGGYQPQQQQQIQPNNNPENDRGGQQDNQRQKDNQGGQVAGANEIRKRESNGISVAEDQPQAKPSAEDSNLAALMEVKDKLSPQQFDWVKEMLLNGDKKITATVSIFKKSKDTKDFTNTVQRFYKKAFGNR